MRGCSFALRLTRASSAQVHHGREGPGHTGARKFKKLMPPLRWQNPHAEFAQAWTDSGASTAVLQFADGATRELDVTGRRSEHILGAVLEAAGATQETVEESVAWAAEWLKPPVRGRAAGGVDEAYGEAELALQGDAGPDEGEVELEDATRPGTTAGA